MRNLGNVAIVVLGLLVLTVAVRGDDDRDHDRGHDEDSRVALGLKISPVKLDLRHANRELVGLGSYIVNAQAGCNDCHTCPSYASDPFHGGTGATNAKNFLAGGTAFSTPDGVFVSANLTPDPSKDNLPDGGHTFAEFKQMMRTGHDADPPHEILQVMPWPVYGQMTDQDLRAVYAYLKAIPHADPGSFFGGNCPAPGLSLP